MSICNKETRESIKNAYQNLFKKENTDSDKENSMKEQKLEDDQNQIATSTNAAKNSLPDEKKTDIQTIQNNDEDTKRSDSESDKNGNQDTDKENGKLHKNDEKKTDIQTTQNNDEDTKRSDSE